MIYHLLLSHSIYIYISNPVTQELFRIFRVSLIFPILEDRDMDDNLICSKLQQDELSTSPLESTEDAILHKIMNFGRDKAPSEVLIDDQKADISSKGKTKICDDETRQNQVKTASANDQGKGSTSGSIISKNLNSSNSQLSYLDEDDNDAVNVDMDDSADDDYEYDDTYMFEDDYVTMQSQFDNVDLPPGVEASLPWLKDIASSQDVTSVTSTSNISYLSESNRKTTISDLCENKGNLASGSHSTGSGESTFDEKDVKEESTVKPNIQGFEQFETVDDFSDHHYSRTGFQGEKPPKNWAKKILEEWKILENNLPDTIFVRVCEARMELLRAVMIGPSGTPYHDGLFVFDCLFPSSYPNEPPSVYYYSGGLRLNPNLYDCGKVCLSLLGTWSGKSTEMWDKNKSTMLQVLVSIQALILNAKPFFNEPGYEKSFVGAEGERKSRSYNEDAFIFSLKTMMYTLRKPPKHFEDLVANHFRNRAHDILVSCKAYMEGAVVGQVVVKNGIPEVDRFEGGSSSDFKNKLSQMMKILINNFTRNGSTDCEQFRPSTTSG